MSGLGKLPALELLDLSNNRIQTLEGLQGCTALKVLHGHAMPADQAFLQRFAYSVHRTSRESKAPFTSWMLQELVLTGNRINSIDGLGRCTRLTELVLTGNKLTSLKGLKDISASLDVRECQILPLF